MESVTNSTDSEEQSTPTRVLNHVKDLHRSSMAPNKKSLAVPQKRGHQSFHQILTGNDASSDTSNESIHPVTDETSLSQPKTPELFVCHFDEVYSPDMTYTSAPKHATMVPTDLLQVPRKTNNVKSVNSISTSKYITPYTSVNSIMTDQSTSSSESVTMDYDLPITGARGRLLRSRRKSLSENNLAALCKAPPSTINRRSSSSTDIMNQAYQIKIEDDIYNLCLPKPLGSKISQNNAYFAISISQNMVRNKHGGSTDV